MSTQLLTARQTSPSRVNPLLAFTREVEETLLGDPWAAERMLDALTADVRAPELFRAKVWVAPQEDCDHAIRVLTRLTNLRAAAREEIIVAGVR